MGADLDALWDFEDPAGSERRLREALDSASGDEALILRTQLARALGLQERYDEAYAVLDAVPPSSGEVGVRSALERGRALRSSGAPDEARPWFETASALAAREQLDGLHVDALHMLAILPDDPAEQVAANRAALEVARASEDEATRRWEAPLLNNLGCALVDAGELEPALATFHQALELRVAQGERRQTQIARWMVAWTLRLLERRDEALTLQRELKAELEADGVEDPYVDEELALLEADEPS